MVRLKNFIFAGVMCHETHQLHRVYFCRCNVSETHQLHIVYFYRCNVSRLYKLKQRKHFSTILWCVSKILFSNGVMCLRRTNYNVFIFAGVMCHVSTPFNPFTPSIPLSLSQTLSFHKSRFLPPNC